MLYRQLTTLTERIIKMNEIKVFENAQFGSVRTHTDENGKVTFCGKDVAEALGYTNARKAILDHCKEKGVTKRYTLTNGGKQELSFIDEGNLYRLITHSKLPSAEKFESWVFDEVLPSIRKHGAYMTADALQQALTSPDFLIQLATNLKAEQEKNRQLETKIEADKPKVIFADAVSVSKTSILVGDLAKILKQNGIDTGDNRLFSWLRENGYLISRKGSDYNSPTQRAMEMGLFEVKETVVTHSDGHTSINKTPKITGKGQQYFINKFIS